MSSFDAITDFKKLPADWSFVRSDWGHTVLRHQIEPKTIDSERVFHYSIPSIQATGTGAEENPEEISSNKFLLRGDELLVSKLNPRKGCVLLAEQQELPTICSTEFVVMKPNNEIFDAQFSYYLYASHPVRAYISGLVQSATRSHQRANPDHISKVWLPNPPLETQRRIAAFLDRKTAAIDALIAKKQRLIALLQEKRQALITHAVTKGLNPDAPMKDSNVPWIGEIPAHWECAQTRRVWQVIDCKHKTVPFIDDGAFPLASIGEVKGRVVDLRTANRTSEEHYLAMIEGGRRPVPGDIIYSRNATVGESALVTGENGAFAMGQDVCLIRPLSGSALYAWLQLNSAHIANQLEAAMVGATFRRINVGVVKCFWICVPPPEEQNGIANFCKAVLDDTESLNSATALSVAKLTEYRQALISAAVTGQLSIPEEAA